jgi:membrane-bound lytic murein transglycosylase MltF
VVDAAEFSLGRHFHPDLRPAFKLAEEEEVAWALAPHSGDLVPEVEGYFAGIEANGRLADVPSATGARSSASSASTRPTSLPA